MKKLLKRFLPQDAQDALRAYSAERLYRRIAYSQEGEDLVLQRLFGEKNDGVFVDVGAHHPFRFSNTCLLYRQGWRGINIDAMPGSMALFKRYRPRDINLELGVSAERREAEFFIFNEAALNTFDEALARQREAAGWPITAVKRVECLPLSDILTRELPKLGVDGIDLLTIDVEGLDFEVLRSNDWSKYRPRALVVEILDHDLSGAAHSDIGQFCADHGYISFAKLHHSVIFVRR
jgi:FkbM family methyltransferase